MPGGTCSSPTRPIAGHLRRSRALHLRWNGWGGWDSHPGPAENESAYDIAGTDRATHNVLLCTPGLKIADAESCVPNGGYSRMGGRPTPVTDRGRPRKGTPSRRSGSMASRPGVTFVISPAPGARPRCDGFGQPIRRMASSMRFQKPSKSSFVATSALGERPKRLSKSTEVMPLVVVPCVSTVT
jgi:hypothetical protein